MESLEVRGISFDHTKSGFIRKDLIQNHLRHRKYTAITVGYSLRFIWDFLQSTVLQWYFFEIVRVSLQFNELSSVNRHYYILSSVTSNNVGPFHTWFHVCQFFFLLCLIPSSLYYFLFRQRFILPVSIFRMWMKTIISGRESQNRLYCLMK